MSQTPSLAEATLCLRAALFRTHPQRIDLRRLRLHRHTQCERGRPSGDDGEPGNVRHTGLSAHDDVMEDPILLLTGRRFNVRTYGLRGCGSTPPDNHAAPNNVASAHRRTSGYGPRSSTNSCPFETLWSRHPSSVLVQRHRDRWYVRGGLDRGMKSAGSSHTERDLPGSVRTSFASKVLTTPPPDCWCRSCGSLPPTP